MITQPTDVPSGNNIEVSGTITEPLVPDVTQSHIINQASTSMLTRSMTAKLTTASASKCLFADFLSKIEPKKVSKALKHSEWIDAMQKELNQFYKNKVWTLVPLPYGKITIGSGNGYPRKGQNQSQNEKTEHENGKTVRSQEYKVKVNKKSKSKSNPRSGIGKSIENRT
ncbi:retrovirus-related pol polyprotein from transposon TNT 1-94 [Tanacetum coccineum]